MQSVLVAVIIVCVITLLLMGRVTRQMSQDPQPTPANLTAVKSGNKLLPARVALAIAKAKCINGHHLKWDDKNGVCADGGR